MDTTITAIEMRQSLGEILDRVAKKGEHITITRGNKPLATLIPASEHENHCQIHGRPKPIDEVLAEIEQWKRNHPGKLKPGKLSSAALIRRMRDSRYGGR